MSKRPIAFDPPRGRSAPGRIIDTFRWLHQCTTMPDRPPVTGSLPRPGAFGLLVSCRDRNRLP